MKNGPYILIIPPDSYPGKRYRGKYAYEHQVVWWINTNELVPEGFVVHHKDENKHNNHIDNLELKSISLHTIEHIKPQEMVKLLCTWCDIEFEKEMCEYNFRVKKGQSNFYCGRSHQVTHQQKIIKQNKNIPV
jgi:hypothetical protein